MWKQLLKTCHRILAKIEWSEQHHFHFTAKFDCSTYFLRLPLFSNIVAENATNFFCNVRITIEITSTLHRHRSQKLVWPFVNKYAYAPHLKCEEMLLLLAFMLDFRFALIKLLLQFHSIQFDHFKEKIRYFSLFYLFFSLKQLNSESNDQIWVKFFEYRQNEHFPILLFFFFPLILLIRFDFFSILAIISLFLSKCIFFPQFFCVRCFYAKKRFFRASQRNYFPRKLQRLL